jgi:hypothetical protein
MGRLSTWGAAARRSPVTWALVTVAVLALVAGGVVLATRPGARSPRPAAPARASTRAVALGDSVPYGHGLHNPYLTPQVGLPARWVSQGPSTAAYPSQVASDFGLTMTVRPTNCALTGDQLAISGAVADAADNTARDGQCPVPAQQARNLGDEVAAAALSRHPARLVLLQDGADDIDFAHCLLYQLANVEGVGIGLGTRCVQNGAVTPGLAAKLADVRTSLASAIEGMAPDVGTIAVLDYYQPIPIPAQIADDSSASRLHTNLVCAGLEANAGGTYAAAQVVLGALNRAIAGAVADARAQHVTNVTLIDVASAFEGHGICTADPFVFSGEPVPDTTLAADAADILAAKSCSATDVLHGAAACTALTAGATRAETGLEGYVWRAAHPDAAGQRALAALVEHGLRGRV